MKWFRMAIVWLPLALGACATSSEIEHNAQLHQAKAHELQAQGDYARAAKEQEAAHKQFAKARARAYDEARMGVYRY
jgi:hypothetical protein